MGSLAPSEFGCIYTFLSTYFLYWLEALSLTKKIPEGVGLIRTLESTLMVDTIPFPCSRRVEADDMKLRLDTGHELIELVRDAKRFILKHRLVIENSPLQIYCSSLIFSPLKCKIRYLFADQFPRWLKTAPVVQEDWDPLLQSLEGHSYWVKSVASPPMATF